jgi:hypothetical protein
MGRGKGKHSDTRPGRLAPGVPGYQESARDCASGEIRRRVEIAACGGTGLCHYILQ